MSRECRVRMIMYASLVSMIFRDIANSRTHYSDFEPVISLVITPCCVLSGKSANTYFIVCLTQLRLKPTIYS
jgi:hypothetical protein